MQRPESLDSLVGKALMDSEFRAQLLADPIAAAKSIGIEISEILASHIKDVDPKALDRVAMDFQKVVGLDDMAVKFW